MFLEQQIGILKLFLNDHVTLKTISSLDSKILKNLNFKIQSVLSAVIEHHHTLHKCETTILSV